MREGERSRSASSIHNGEYNFKPYCARSSVGGISNISGSVSYVNPFGGIPTFFALTSGFTRTERNQTAHRTGFYVFAILVTFLFFGRFVLHFFGISLPVLKIAGGHCGEYGMGDGYGEQSDYASRKRRSCHQGGYFVGANGYAHSVGAGVYRCCDGVGRQRKFDADLRGHGDWDCGASNDYLPVSSAGRTVGRAPGPEHRRRHQSHFRFSDPGHRRSVGMGWDSGFPRIVISRPPKLEILRFAGRNYLISTSFSTNAE